MLQFLSPEMEKLRGYFPMGLDWGTLENTLELSSRPEEVIYYFYLTSDPSFPSTNSTPLSPWSLVIFLCMICDLRASQSRIFQILSLPILWIDQFSNKPYVCIANPCSHSPLGQCMQADEFKYWDPGNSCRLYFNINPEDLET